MKDQGFYCELPTLSLRMNPKNPSKETHGLLYFWSQPFCHNLKNSECFIKDGQVPWKLHRLAEHLLHSMNNTMKYTSPHITAAAATHLSAEVHDLRPVCADCFTLHCRPTQCMLEVTAWHDQQDTEQKCILRSLTWTLPHAGLHSETLPVKVANGTSDKVQTFHSPCLT